MTKNDLLKPATLNIREFLSEGKYVIPIISATMTGEKGKPCSCWKTSPTMRKRIRNRIRNRMRDSLITSVRQWCFFAQPMERRISKRIDGQQRLTTLTILACLLKHQKRADWFEKPNLSYDHRKEADEALMMLVNGQLSQHPSAQNIVSVYRLFEKHLQPMLTAKELDLETFADYLFEKVIILRIPVPQDTSVESLF